MKGFRIAWVACNRTLMSEETQTEPHVDSRLVPVETLLVDYSSNNSKRARSSFDQSRMDEQHRSEEDCICSCPSVEKDSAVD